MKKSLLSCALITLLWVAPIQANDTAFGGSGAAPMPIKQVGIKMKSEHIVLRGKGLDRKDFKGEWNVTCDFTFTNTLNTPVRLQMGFPFPVRNKYSETASPAGRKPFVGDPLVYDFSVQVQGRPVTIRPTKIAPRPDMKMYYKDAYVWDTTFAPHKTVKIHHTYTTGLTFDVMGYNWAQYVLKTGGLWKDGTIGRTLLEVIPNVPTRLCNEIERKDAAYLHPKPAGVQIVGSGKERRYRWDLRNYRPKNDLNVCLITGMNYVKYFIVFRIIHQGTGSYHIDLTQKSPAQLRILRNTIFAQYGRGFKDRKLQAYFDSQWWYVKNPRYNDDMLTSEDKQAIAMIKQ